MGHPSSAAELGAAAGDGARRRLTPQDGSLNGAGGPHSERPPSKKGCFV